MRTQQKLQLRKEALVDLSSDELQALAGADRPTYGNFCQAVYVWSDAIIFILTGTSGANPAAPAQADDR